MKETRVAGSQGSHQIVHGQFEGIGIAEGENTISLVSGELGPIHAIEFRVEVILGDFGPSSVEDFSALRQR